MRPITFRQRIALWTVLFAALALTSALSGARAESTYRIAVGDVLAVSVINLPNLNAPQATVLSDGMITLPLLGRVTVAGKTTDAVQTELEKSWNDYVVNPTVTVSVTTQHVQQVLVNGFVGRPGATAYLPGLRALDVIAAGGGALMTGDLSKTVVTHQSGGTQALDLSNPETKGSSVENILTQPGDNVYVPERHMKIGIVGALQHPGSYEYMDRMTVLDAITAAGGVTEDASLPTATLTHNGQTTGLDLDAMLRRGDMSRNVVLSAGDRIVIPEGYRIYVFGQVVRPGYYFYKVGDRMLDALNGVGGPLQDADLSKVNYITVNNDKTAATFQRVNLGKFLRVGDISTNLPLQPGVVLYLPRQKWSFKAEDLYPALASLNLLNTGAHLATRGVGR